MRLQSRSRGPVFMAIVAVLVLAGPGRAQVVPPPGDSGASFREQPDTIPAASEDPAVRAVDTGYAEVAFQSTPAGAAVYFDGKRIGFTPLGRRKVTAGKHQIRFSAFGYQMAVDSVVLPAGAFRRINARLSKTSPSLFITSVPSPAAVFIRGQQVGTTPFRDSLLDSGWHRIKVLKEGYEPLECRYLYTRQRIDTLACNLHSLAHADSLRNLSRRRTRWTIRVISGTLAAGCAAIGVFNNGRYARALENLTGAYESYDTGGLTLTEYDQRWYVVQRRRAAVDESRSRRNWTYGFAGLFALGFGATFVF